MFNLAAVRSAAPLLERRLSALTATVQWPYQRRSVSKAMLSVHEDRNNRSSGEAADRTRPETFSLDLRETPGPGTQCTEASTTYRHQSMLQRIGEDYHYRCTPYQIIIGSSFNRQLAVVFLCNLQTVRQTKMCSFNAVNQHHKKSGHSSKRLINEQFR
jgi:hypothetical protein